MCILVIMMLIRYLLPILLLCFSIGLNITLNFKFLKSSSVVYILFSSIKICCLMSMCMFMDFRKCFTGFLIQIWKVQDHFLWLATFCNLSYTCHLRCLCTSMNLLLLLSTECNHVKYLGWEVPWFLFLLDW